MNHEYTREFEHEFAQWLNRATEGLPWEIQKSVRAELADHYTQAVDAYGDNGETPETVHQRVMLALGDAAATARDLRTTHLSTHRYLSAFIALCFVLGWFVLNSGRITPIAWTSGTLRIIAGAVIFLVFEGTLWALRDLVTGQLRLSAFKLPLNLLIIGCALTLPTFFCEVLFSRAAIVVEFIPDATPTLWARLFQIASATNAVASGLLAIGLLLFVRRLAPSRAHLYGMVGPLKLTALLGGLMFTCSAILQVLSFFGIYFVMQSSEAGYRTGLFIPPGSALETPFWLTDGIDWITGLISFSSLCLGLLLALMALLFFRAYRQNIFGLRQAG